MQATEWPVTFSFGAAVFTQCPGSVDEMILAADDLMYRVKRAGKNNIAVVEVPITTKAY